MQSFINRVSWFLPVMLFLISCSKSPDIRPEKYLSKQEADTLLTDIITYVYTKAPYSDYQTRHEARFRGYYLKNLSQFQLKYYFITPDSTHYFYAIRPARSLKGNKRGVCGSFRLGEGEGSQRLHDFREIFNTIVMSDDSLASAGEKIFRYLIKHGNADIYIYDPRLVEFPQPLVKYDTLRKEWRYAGDDQQN